MKITLYAEKNNGILYALPHECTADTTKNGWLFSDIEYIGQPVSFDCLDAESCDSKLFVIPKKFGCGQLSADGIDVEITVAQADGGYIYRNLPIGGGGYVTGFAFDEDGWLYCRTDIGGCYSCAPPHNKWKALSHNAGVKTEWLCNPLSVTCHENKLYALFGNHTGSFVGVSEDKGESFEFYPFPEFVHGNCLGRSTGERIAVTSDSIFIGTRGGGLLRSSLKMDKWEKLCLPADSDECVYMFRGRENPRVPVSAADDITFVRAVDDRIIIVGTAENKGVFVSCNAGESFTRLDGQPECHEESGLPFISQRSAVCGDMLFITYSCTASDRSWQWYSYACDGSKIFDGRVLCFRLADGRYSMCSDITPQGYRGGFSGIDISADGKTLVCTTVCGAPDRIYLSRDMGETWKEVLTSKENAKQEFRTPYMKPENNNGQSVIHWMSDIKLNPDDSKSAYINTGTGVFRTRSLGDDVTVWEDFSSGIEETVHLDICSPPSGKVRVIDVVGDLGGFSFTDINRECDFTFRDENKNRYITAINADFAEKCPETAVISPRGNWIGTSKGGAAVSFDGGISWRGLSNPYAMNERTDELLRRIEEPNVDPGWVAVSCDGGAIIRQVADFRRRLPAHSVFVTHNIGKSWVKSCFCGSDGRELAEESLCVRIFSDRHNESCFYAFGSGGEIFRSLDCGAVFRQMIVEGELPQTDYSITDWGLSPNIRVSPFRGGEVLMCFADHGIFRLNVIGDIVRCERILPESRCNSAFCGGWGKGGVLYFCGTVDGVYGFWKSLDGDFVRVNTDSQQFGQIRSMCGDPRAYGRFYIATGSFGGLYGEMSR